MLLDWKHPEALVALVVPLLLMVIAWRRRGKRPALVLSTAAAFRVAPRSFRTRLLWLPLALRLVALVALVLAIARPRTADRYEEVVTQGVDMIVALDVSGSMRAEDFRPRNRLHVAREVVQPSGVLLHVQHGLPGWRA